MKLDVYEHLLIINTAFDQLARCLIVLQKHRKFHAAELNRFRLLAKETRASLNSYLTAIIEGAETDEAGRRYSKRLAQERADDRDGGS